MLIQILNAVLSFFVLEALMILFEFPSDRKTSSELKPLAVVGMFFVALYFGQFLITSYILAGFFAVYCLGITLTINEWKRSQLEAGIVNDVVLLTSLKHLNWIDIFFLSFWTGLETIFGGWIYIEKSSPSSNTHHAAGFMR